MDRRVYGKSKVRMGLSRIPLHLAPLEGRTWQERKIGTISISCK